jgi:hypothetical protein
MLTGREFHMLRDLFNEGLSIIEIARQAGHDRTTIRKYINIETPPLRKDRPEKPGKLDPFKDCIIRRLNEHSFSALHLYREIQDQGFTGKYGIVKYQPSLEKAAIREMASLRFIRNAMNCGVTRISAYWHEEDSSQVVICLVEGDEARITAFKKFIESHKPVKAEVSAITWEDYEGDVMRIGEFAQICTCMVLQRLFR